MALRRITIDIEDWGKNKSGRPLYGLAIVSENGRKDSDGITTGKLHTLVEFAVDDALDSLKPA
jgi:hypothetical protein